MRKERRVAAPQNIRPPYSVILLDLMSSPRWEWTHTRKLIRERRSATLLPSTSFRVVVLRSRRPASANASSGDSPHFLAALAANRRPHFPSQGPGGHLALCGGGTFRTGVFCEVRGSRRKTVFREGFHCVAMTLLQVV